MEIPLSHASAVYLALAAAGCMAGSSPPPSPAPTLAGSCFGISYQTVADTIMLDTLPPTFWFWRTAGSNYSRVLVYPNPSDTLPAAQRDREMPFLWRQEADSLILIRNGLPLRARVRGDRFTGRAQPEAGLLEFRHGHGHFQGEGPVQFWHVQCPANWSAAS